MAAVIVEFFGGTNNCHGIGNAESCLFLDNLYEIQ